MIFKDFQDFFKDSIGLNNFLRSSNIFHEHVMYMVDWVFALA